MNTWRRTRCVAVALVSGVAMSLVLLAGPASAAAATYTATISPQASSIGATKTYTVTITNSSPLSSLIGINRATITIPAGFTNVVVGTPSPSSWSASYNAGTMTVTTRSGLLLPGQSVHIPITATAPSATGTYTWSTTASTTLGGPATRVGPDPSVEVATSVVDCPPNQSCDSGRLSAPATGTTLATDAEVLANAGPPADTLITNLPDPVVHTMSCSQSNFGAIVEWTVKSRSTRLTYTVHPTNEDYVYDVGDTCFGSPKEFNTANGTPAQFNPANNEFEGTIPMCVGSNPGPCVQSINQPAPDDPPPTTTVVRRSAAEGEEPPSPVTFVIISPIDSRYHG